MKKYVTTKKRLSVFFGRLSWRTRPTGPIGRLRLRWGAHFSAEGAHPGASKAARGRGGEGVSPPCIGRRHSCILVGSEALKLQLSLTIIHFYF
jgi:hypothetical protein